MHVNRLDHINIRTTDTHASARFYTALLQLEARNGPAPYPAEQVQWLYDHNGNAIIHLYRGDAESRQTGAIHHVALSCTGKAELLARAAQQGLEIATHERPDIGLSQIFIRDPHGILFELNFVNEA